MREIDARRLVLSTALALGREGLSKGTSGNVSMRFDDGFLITPSGMTYDSVLPEMVVFVAMDGSFKGPLKPSSEWRFHRDIYADRPDVGGVVHAHSSFATTLACMGRDIPAIHYVVALAGGYNIRVAPYATFGTQELSDYAIEALQSRKACLLANHGQIAVGEDLPSALAMAVEVEELAAIYWRTLVAGGGNLLGDGEMDVVLEKFKAYGANAQKP